MYYDVFTRLVIKLRKDLLSKYFVNRDCNCNSTTKPNIICTYKGEYNKCCIFYKSNDNVMTISMLEILKISTKENRTTLTICGTKGNTK